MGEIVQKEPDSAYIVRYVQLVQGDFSAAFYLLIAEDCIMVGNDVNEDMCAAEIGIKTFLLTDCMINAEGKDISSYDRGGFPELEEYLMQHYDI